MNSIFPPQSLENSRKNQTFWFNEFSFDAVNKTLWRGGEIVSIPPKTGELLAVFIEHAGQVLAKEYLLNRVWHDAYVEEANLSHHIAVLRKTFGESKNGNKYIQTIPRKGYRFVAEVSTGEREMSEISYRERTTTEIVEETIIETDVSENPAAKIAPQSFTASKILNNSAKSPVKLHSALTFGLIGIAVLIVLGWMFWAKSDNSAVSLPTPQNIVFKRLMPDVSVRSPVISPDGLTLVYVKDDEQQAAVWRKNIAGGETDELLPEVSFVRNYSNLRFSPDGLWLYYVIYNEESALREAFRIPTKGGIAQKIASNVESDYAVSPDGKQLAFIRDNRFLVIVETTENGAERIAAECDGIKTLFFSNENSSLAFSPDGARVAVSFMETKDGYRRRGLAEIVLSDGTYKAFPLSQRLFINKIEWLTDGDLIVTSALTKGAARQLYHISYTDGKVTRLTNDDADYEQISLTSDGQKLIVLKTLGQFNIWEAALENNSVSPARQITHGIIADHGKNGIGALPDGRIIYTSSQSGSNDLWAVDKKNNSFVQITANAGNTNRDPILTPDNRFVVFVSTRSGTPHIWRMNADGTNQIQLSQGNEEWNPSVSPDSRWVYYATRAPNQKDSGELIYKIPIEGGEPIAVKDRFYVDAPVFSADGKWILYHGRETENARTRTGLIDAATGKTVRFFDNVKMPDWSPVWSPDSKIFYYTDSNRQTLWQQPIDGSAAVKVADFTPRYIYNFTVASDNQKIVFSLGNIMSEAVLLTDFLGKNK